jgi:hypothetical protein
MATVEELELIVADMKAVTPVVEELLFSTNVTCWVDSSGNLTRSPLNHRTTLMVAPFAMRVLGVDVAFEYWSCPESDTNYWELTLEKGSGVSFPDIAVKTTQATGTLANGPIIPRTAWSFDSANWGDADMAKGQLLAMNLARVGTPPTIMYPATYTIRYRPL